MNPSPALPHWDLSPLYTGPADPAIERDITAMNTTADAFSHRYQTRVATLDAAELREALTALEGLFTTLYRMQGYAGLATATDTHDDALRAMQSRVGEAGTDTLNRVRFFDLELAAVSAETHARWAQSADLAGYQHHLQRVRASAPHTLGRDVENAVATKNLTGRSAWGQLYAEVTAGWTFPFTVGDTTRDMNLAEVRALRADADRDVRHRAHVAVLSRFGSESRLFAFILNTLYQDHRSENELRRYATSMAPTLLDDELDQATVDALMTAVEDHYPVAQRYFRLKAKALGLETLTSHDVLAPYPSATRGVPWEEARDQVLKAFGALDPEVEAIARGFFDTRRIDAEPRAGKRDGAFCSGLVPGTPPYVMVNYAGTLHDVSTLAHELGHGVHFHLAGQAQSLLNYWPSTPMAETASVFGELVLSRNLLAHETDPAVRRQLLAMRIEEALGTIHRQVCFTRFERNAHARRALGVVPAAEFSALWSHEHDRLYGNAVARGPHDVWGWAAIPHLVHYRFYCYSYAVGQLLVFALYRAWESDPRGFVPRYLAMLSMGGSTTPAAMLASVGIDTTDPAFWARGLDVVTRMVDDFASQV